MPSLLILLGIFIYSQFKNGKALYNELRFSVKKIDFKNISFSGARFNMFLGIDNPTPYGITIKSLTGIVQTATGETLGTYDVLTPFTIAPKKVTEIQITVTAGSFAVVQQIAQVIKTGKVPPLNLTGNIETSLGRFPFTNNVTAGMDLIKKTA